MTAIQTRKDVIDWALSLLPDPYNCLEYVGATYSREIRRLEWASRPLWAVFALMAGGDDAYPEVASRIKPFLDHVREGLTPGSGCEFPRPAREVRQVVVEMQPYAFDLLACGDKMLNSLDEPQRERLTTWLNGINDVELPWGVWHMYRLFVNAALAAGEHLLACLVYGRP